MASRFVILISGVLGLLVPSAFASYDPCIGARSLPFSSQRSINYDAGTCGNQICDNYIQPGLWYTLDGETTGNQLPESCVPVWRCGTYIPIWLNGIHPTADNPGPMTVDVCAQVKANGDCCAWKDRISVKYCKGDEEGDKFYVYQLKVPPYCDMAYCGGNGVYCGSNGTWNDVRGKCINPSYPSLTRNPVLSDPFIAETKTVTDTSGNPFVARKFGVRCTFQYQRSTSEDDGARFDVIFEAGGKNLVKFTLPSTAATEYSAVMDESFLVGYLDKTLRCKVLSYWQSPYPVRGTRYSNEFYYGIRTLDENDNVITSISVAEAQRRSIRMLATFPVTTPGCFNLIPGAGCRPNYQFRIYTQKLLLSNCSFQLSYENPKSDPILLTPIPTQGTVRPAENVWPMFYQFRSSFIQNTGSVFERYKSAAVDVSIIDTVPAKECHFLGDPHVTTFARRYYDLLIEGDFYLVRLASRQLEVQVRTISCQVAREISCTCGVMVREGNNIIGINRCDSAQTRLIRYLRDEENPGGTVSQSGNTWIISTLSGFQVRVTLWHSKYFHVSPVGLGNENYEGLCTYSGPQSVCTTDCNQNERYRVASQDSMFTFSSANVPSCRTAPFLPSCDCTGNEGDTVPCYEPDQRNLAAVSYFCNRSNKRQKRSTEPTNSDETTFDIDLFASNRTINLQFGTGQTSPVWPTKNNITELQARGACDSVLRNSPTYEYCTAVLSVNISSIITSCATDIKYADDLSYADKSIAEVLQNDCNYTIEKESIESNKSRDSQTKEKQKTLEAMICPKQCSQRGNCVGGKCVCQSGYSDSDCSVASEQRPTITGAITQTCDINGNANTCLKVHIYANNTGSNTTCKIRNITGVYIDENPQRYSGEVICNLRRAPVGLSDLNLDATANYTIFVAISNDGVRFSNELKFLIFDGICVSCTTDTCAAKPNACVILGRCYSAERRMQCTENRQGFCRPGICQTKWIFQNSDSCSGGFESCLSSGNQLPTSVRLVLVLLGVVATVKIVTAV